MNSYVTGAMIKRMRESRNLTQQGLAQLMNVSDKTVSKWETGRGYPDISLLEPLSRALGVSLIELFSGDDVINTNRSFNMLKLNIYVCPVCNNVILSAGEAVVSCHGIVLPALEAEEGDPDHIISACRVEDEYYITLSHEMSKSHYISFLIAVQDDGYEIKKLYPEGDAAAHFKISKTEDIYCYCNRHGLFKMKI